MQADAAAEGRRCLFEPHSPRQDAVPATECGGEGDSAMEGCRAERTPLGETVQKGAPGGKVPCVLKWTPRQVAEGSPAHSASEALTTGKSAPTNGGPGSAPRAGWLGLRGRAEDGGATGHPEETEKRGCILLGVGTHGHGDSRGDRGVVRWFRRRRGFGGTAALPGASPPGEGNSMDEGDTTFHDNRTRSVPSSRQHGGPGRL